MTFIRNAVSSLLLMLLISIPVTLHAAEAAVLTDESGRYTVTKSFEIFEDKTRTVEVRKLHDGGGTYRFKKVGFDSINLGFRDSFSWMRATIINKSSQEDWLIEVAYPCLDYLTFYNFDGTELRAMKSSGDMLPFGNRDMDFRTFVFKLHIEKGAERTVYFKIHGEGPMIFPINIYSPYVFSESVNDEVILFGIYFGIFAVMMIFNLFIYFSIRDKSYLFYVLYIFTTFVGYLALNGFLGQYILPDNPVLVNKTVPFSISLMLCLSSIFSKSFLNLHKNFRKGDTALIIAAVIMGGVMVISVFGSYNISIKLCGALGSFVAVNIIIVSSISLYRGNRLARFFLAAWIFMLVGMILYALRSYGLVPDVFITGYGAQIGSVFEVVLLSIALADRINILKQENVQAQEKFITMQRDYTESLERTVHERTHELEIERNKLRSRNELMEHELSLARKIQEQLIPVQRPAKYIYSLYKPMDQVGGDFFDFIKFRDSEEIGIFLSDVSGHGVPAAFITSMVKSIILQAGESKRNPAELLNYINEILFNQTGGNFVTVFYGIYDPLDHTLLYSNAGHNPPTIILDGSITYLQSARSIPVGVMNNQSMVLNNKNYSNSSITLPGSCKLLLFTDGFVEARPEENPDQFFEYTVMNEVLLELKHLPSEQFIKELYKRLVEFRGSSSFDDDVCLICLDVQ